MSAAFNRTKAWFLSKLLRAWLQDNLPTAVKAMD
jgi:cell pole-organizing protein PopZ